MPHTLRRVSGDRKKRRSWSVVYKSKRFSSGVGVRGGAHAAVALNTLMADRGDGSPGTLSYFDETLASMPLSANSMGFAFNLLQQHTIPMKWGDLHPVESWARMGHGKRYRRVIVANIELNNSIFTLLEIERREKELVQATLGVTGIPQPTELAALFYACAKGHGVLRDTEWESLSLTRRRRLKFWHEAKGSANSSPENYAKRILSTIATQFLATSTHYANRNVLKASGARP